MAEAPSIRPGLRPTVSMDALVEYLAMIGDAESNLYFSRPTTLLTLRSFDHASVAPLGRPVRVLIRVELKALPSAQMWLYSTPTVQLRPSRTSTPAPTTAPVYQSFSSTERPMMLSWKRDFMSTKATPPFT